MSNQRRCALDFHVLEDFVRGNPPALPLQNITSQPNETAPLIPVTEAPIAAESNEDIGINVAIDKPTEANTQKPMRYVSRCDSPTDEEPNQDWDEAADDNEASLLDNSESEQIEQGGNTGLGTPITSSLPDPPTSDPSSGSATLQRNPFITKWQTLWAVLATQGAQNLTKEQYNLVRSLLSGIQSEVQPDTTEKAFGFPHYDTVTRTTKEDVFDHAAVRAKKFIVPVNLESAGTRATCVTDDGKPGTTIHVITPSKYALADFACSTISDELISTSREIPCPHTAEGNCPHQDRCQTIDNLPLIANRHWYYGSARAIAVDFAETNERLIAAESDIIAVETKDIKRPTEGTLPFFSSSAEENFIIARTEHIFTVSAKADEDDGLNASNRANDAGIAGKIFWCDNYDGASVEEDRETGLPTEEERRFVKPGDLMAICEPITGSETHHRIVLVLRFWREIGQAERFFFCISLE